MQEQVYVTSIKLRCVTHRKRSHKTFSSVKNEYVVLMLLLAAVEQAGGGGLTHSGKAFVSRSVR